MPHLHVFMTYCGIYDFSVLFDVGPSPWLPFFTQSREPGPAKMEIFFANVVCLALRLCVSVKLQTVWTVTDAIYKLFLHPDPHQLSPDGCRLLMDKTS